MHGWHGVFALSAAEVKRIDDYVTFTTGGRRQPEITERRIEAILLFLHVVCLFVLCIMRDGGA
jgi:hypothetical protein